MSMAKVLHQHDHQRAEERPDRGCSSPPITAMISTLIAAATLMVPRQRRGSLNQISSTPCQVGDQPSTGTRLENTLCRGDVIADGAHAPRVVAGDRLQRQPKGRARTSSQYRTHSAAIAAQPRRRENELKDSTGIAPNETPQNSGRAAARCKPGKPR